MIKKLLFPTVLAVMLSVASMHAIAAANRVDLMGEPAPAASAYRTIAITRNTNYVNVEGGEVVRFVVDGKTFAWSFNGVYTSFDLNQIAPPNVLDHKVTAYVAPDPRYVGGND